MKWTTEPITEPGWYWFEKEAGAWVRYVFNDGDGMVVGLFDKPGCQSVDSLCEGKRWCRIPRPEEPGD